MGEGFFFHAPVPRDASRETFDFLGLLREAAGFELQAEFDHVGFWDLRVLVAREYRKGRAFIAGDACHSHPPYGGFGLNTGLEDAVNLGWKLTAALEGWGGETLLDSYGEERRPIFVETGEAMIAGGIEADRAFLERYSPSKDRAEFEQAWKALQAERPLARGLRAALRGLVGGARPAGGGVQHPRQARPRRAGRAPPQPADALVGPERLRSSWAGASRCSPSAPTTTRCRRSRTRRGRCGCR